MAYSSPAFSDWTASSTSPMINEKARYQQTIYTPLPTQHHHDHNPTFPPEPSIQHLLNPSNANPSLARLERLKR